MCPVLKCDRCGTEVGGSYQICALTLVLFILSLQLASLLLSHPLTSIAITSTTNRDKFIITSHRCLSQEIRRESYLQNKDDKILTLPSYMLEPCNRAQLK